VSAARYRQKFESPSKGIPGTVSGVLEAGVSKVQRETPPFPVVVFWKGGCFQKTCRKRLLEKGVCKRRRTLKF
jgi:hypothetical protein